jgi:tetratricopeptide (TPR) repeat protein
MKVTEKAKELERKGNIREAIELLEEFVETNRNERIGAHNLLSRLYLKLGKKDEAVAVLRKAIENNQDNLWFYLMLGDLYYFDLNDTENAISVYEKGASFFRRAERSTMSPYRYFLKRLSNIYYDIKRREEALKFFESFMTLEPSDFYGSDFVKYADLLIQDGHIDHAREVLYLGLRTHPGDRELYDFAQRSFPEEKFILGQKRKKGTIVGVEKILVKTPILKEGDDISRIVNSLTKDIRKEGDIVTVSSCVAAICEGRAVIVDTITPTSLAKLLSLFVSHRNMPFGGAAPLANPYAMEIAIRETGVLRIIIAGIIGGLGKLFRKSGWFYMVAGPQSAIIDDPPAAIPPYDYAVIPGPKDSFFTAKRIQEAIGCRAAVIDANDAGIAWAIGYTEGIDKEKLEIALSDNPAGNEDQQTPIIIVRGLP